MSQWLRFEPKSFGTYRMDMEVFLSNPLLEYGFVLIQCIKLYSLLISVYPFITFSVNVGN